MTVLEEKGIQMLYTPSTKRALALCFDAHKDQKDKSGMPYVFHPFHLAEQMTDEDSVIVALLHDVVEDSWYSLRDLENMGFDAQVIDAMELMTHDDRTPYLEYVAQIRENPIARAVKAADLRHNSDASRLDVCTVADMRRMLKYKMALAILAEDLYNTGCGCYRKIIPLAHDRPYFLSVFYADGKVLEYSLDVEVASDSHYKFRAEDAEQILHLLPPADSLPEAMADYLEKHDEHQFCALLRGSGIGVKVFHYD